MSNRRLERIDRIPTREATIEQLTELRIDAKEKYLKLQFTRKTDETRSGKLIDMSKEELLWKDELRRLTSTINYRNRAANVKKLTQKYNLVENNNT